LFLVTCLSTFWAGTTRWYPFDLGGRGFHLALLNGGAQGALYMACVLSILFAHEMGHYVATVIHRVPASLPFFIPFPFTPIGTLGAVIAMDGRQANRRQIFDIGIAGPLAGLVLAVPILAFGVAKLDFQTEFADHGFKYDCPLLVEWMIRAFHPTVREFEIARGQLNSYFMAGWVGLLVTGLNMLPVSQLDGGHIIYALFGKRAHWIARGFIIFAIVFTVLIVDGASIWWPMLILVILMGTDHPPTSDDTMSLGRLRKVIGYASLLIPVLCFPVRGIIQN
jgi:membrane-associated protease RseP (regulator of RpoE activity)